MIWGRRLFLLFLAALFWLPALPSRPALAATAPVNITVSPMPVLLSAKPGSSLNYNLRVQNSGTADTKLRVDLYKFGANGSTGQPQLSKPGPGDDFTNWVSFSPAIFDAPPNVWINVNLSIKPPKDAAFGYYFAAVFSPASPQLTTKSNSNTIQGAAAILVLLDVNAPGEKRQLSTVSLTTDKKVYEYLPVKFSIKVRNTGNVHASPAGDIFISKGNGPAIATLDINPAQGNILPGTTRSFDITWTDGFPVFQYNKKNDVVATDKKGNPIYKLNWDFSKVNKFRFGHYTAHLLLTYDNGSQDIPVNGYVSFWVIPWKLMLIVMLVVLAILTGLVMMLRGGFKRASRLKKKLKKTDRGEKPKI